MPSTQQQKSSSDNSQPGRGNGDRSALLILLVVIGLCGSTLWMIRDAWLSTSTKTAAQSDEHFHPGKAVRERVPSQRAIPAERSEDNSLHNSFEPPAKREAASSGKLERETGRVEQNHRNAGEKPELLRAGIQKPPTGEHATQAEPERQRLESRQRLEQEKSRRALDARAAQEKAERAALKHRAEQEQQRLLEARRAAAQAKPDRTRARTALETAGKRTAEEMVQPQTAAADTHAEESSTVADVPDEAATAGSGGFLSNPCEGPSAKFLSTCR